MKHRKRGRKLTRRIHRMEDGMRRERIALRRETVSAMQATRADIIRQVVRIVEEYTDRGTAARLLSMLEES